MTADPAPGTAGTAGTDLAGAANDPVCVLVSYFPFPENRGDPVRVNAAIAALAESGPVTVLAVGRPDTADAEIAAFRERHPAVALEVFAFEPRGIAARWREAVRRGVPPWVAGRHSRALAAALAPRLAAREPVVAIGEAAGVYLLGAGDARWHWDKANVLSASAVLDVREATGRVERAKRRAILVLSRRYERRLLAGATSVSVTSPEEDDRLHAALGRRADLVIPSSVPVPARPSNRSAARTVAWLGSLEYPSNVNGLLRFVEEGWPLLARNGFTLAVIGGGASPELRARLKAAPGVRPLGYVADLAGVLGTARFAVVPLWSGAGMKLKTLTLLAHGLAVAGTPMAFEGLPTDGAVLPGDTPAALSRAILECSADEARALGAAGRAAVAAQFSAPAVQRRYARIPGLVAGR